MNPENFDCCPKCGGKTGIRIEENSVSAQSWGKPEKRILFYMTTAKIFCLDCQFDFAVKNPDSSSKES
jgi:hypothetical protein